MSVSATDHTIDSEVQTNSSNFFHIVGVLCVHKGVQLLVSTPVLSQDIGLVETVPHMTHNKHDRCFMWNSSLRYYTARVLQLPWHLVLTFKNKFRRNYEYKQTGAVRDMDSESDL